MKLTTGTIVTDHQLTALSAPVTIPDGDWLVHLQFRRFAGCPLCNMHLRTFATRHDDLIGAGIREVIVFHSAAEELRPHVALLPFAVIADPGKRLYREFGVESDKRALLDPRAWRPVIRGIVHDLWDIVRHRRPVPALNPQGGRLGLPADFLIASDGRVLAAKYGEHGYDQWSVDEVLSLATQQSFPIQESLPIQESTEPIGAQNDR
jgi:peroxiredoxin